MLIDRWPTAAIAFVIAPRLFMIHSYLILEYVVKPLLTPFQTVGFNESLTDQIIEEFFSDYGGNFFF
ncbi:hypothetical protein [Sutcliffiella halmapala]|uniref:hypothetical protein n=1 Tax=Sutcliffiella halmapala TaxID=79882 RepID=UPI00099499DF|nr:hypothetical protein [Sutcliffiella halmapala]